MADKVDPIVANFTLAYFFAALFNAILVVIKEGNEGVHDWMASIPPWNHHWATHGLFVILAFVILGVVFKAINLHEKMANDYTKLGYYVIGGTLLALLVIMGYFMVEGVMPKL